MTFVDARRRAFATATILASLLLASASASAQSPNRVDTLDREALEAFHNLEIDVAVSRLDSALSAAARSPAQVRARLHVHRGVIAAAGQQDRSRAVDEFRLALALDPNASIETELNSPEASSAFEIARRPLAQPATVRPTGPAATPAPATSTTATSPVATPADTAAASPADAEPTLEPTEAPSTNRLVGDACASTSECGDGLECIDSVCAQSDDAFVEPREAPRFFMQYGYGFGAGLARSNMEADGTIPYDPETKPNEWNDLVNGPYAPPGYTETQWSNQIQATWGSYVAPGANPGSSPVTHSESCDADAGHYCVRVKSGGLAATSGLRVTMGYWLTPRIAVSTEWRFSTHSGIGTFSRLMGSARVHYRIVRTGDDHRGLAVDVLGGLGFGQIQLRVDQGRYVGPNLCESGTVAAGERCDDAAANPTPSAAYVFHGDRVKRPWIQTGPYSVQVGATVTYHFNRSFGLYARPIAYVLLPAFTIVGELGLGAEIAF